MARGWPSWAVGLALFALVLVILVGAFFLNDRLKPKVGTEPVASAVTSTGPTAIPSLIPTVGGAIPAATLDPTVEKATVVQAYLHYWDVYNSALLTLDTAKLSEVAADEELARDTQSVEELRSGHQALKSDITHHLEVTSVGADAATVHDQFEDRSYLIDPTSKQAVETPVPARTETIACQLRLVNGIWKVVNVVKVSVTVVPQ